MIREYADIKYSSELYSLFEDYEKSWIPENTESGEGVPLPAITIQMCLDKLPESVLETLEIYNSKGNWFILFDCDRSKNVTLDFVEFSDKLLVNSLCKFLIYLVEEDRL